MMNEDQIRVCTLAAEVLLGRRGNHTVTYDAGAAHQSFAERRCTVKVEYHDADGGYTEEATVKENDWCLLLAEVCAKR